MRKKVLKVARKLGYTPNVIARSLITKRTNMIGFVMADISNPFYPEVLEKFTQKLQALGRRILLFTVSRGQDIDGALPQILQYQVDGVVITSASLSSEMAEKCAQTGTPVVLFNRYVRVRNVSSVCCDNTEGGQLVANLLLDAGHKRFAYIAGSENTSTNVDRERGFIDRLEERGSAPPLREVGNYTYNGGRDAVKRLLQSHDPPDAIFCANDIMALGVLDTVRCDYSIKVPEDMSIIGFDDIRAAAWPSYDLTTIRQQIDEMINVTVDILLARIDDPEAEPVMRLVPGQLIVRSSARLAEATGGERPVLAGR